MKTEEWKIAEQAMKQQRDGEALDALFASPHPSLPGLQGETPIVRDIDGLRKEGKNNEGTPHSNRAGRDVGEA